MKLDITTGLSTYLDRLVDDMLDVIAKEGLVLLKRILDESGFADSPYLKDYQVYAHVLDDVVVFEIVLNVEAVVAEDEVTRQALEESAKEGEKVEEGASRTYAMGPDGPQRLVGRNNAMRDARRPAMDARRPARDARTTARDRLIAKEVANIAPRSAKVDRDGRLSVALKRSAKVDGEGVVMPQGEFQGIVGRFVREISSSVASSFSSGLADIIGRYVV